MLRGRRIRVPRGASVRPTADRVREALFARSANARRCARARSLRGIGRARDRGAVARRAARGLRRARRLASPRCCGRICDQLDLLDRDARSCAPTSRARDPAARGARASASISCCSIRPTRSEAPARTLRALVTSRHPRAPRDGRRRGVAPDAAARDRRAAAGRRTPLRRHGPAPVRSRRTPPREAADDQGASMSAARKEPAAGGLSGQLRPGHQRAPRPDPSRARGLRRAGRRRGAQRREAGDLLGRGAHRDARGGRSVTSPASASRPSTACSSTTPARSARTS